MSAGEWVLVWMEDGEMAEIDALRIADFSGLPREALVASVHHLAGKLAGPQPAPRVHQPEWDPSPEEIALLSEGGSV